MAKIAITGPDGKTVELTAPDGASEQQIMAKIDAVKSNWSKVSGPSTSATGSFLTGLGQSIFGFGDEIEAGVRAGLDPEKTYDEVLPEVRQRVADSASEHPLAYYGGEIGGAIAVPGGLARAGIQSATRAAAGKGLGAMIKAGGKEGAAYGAAHGFGRSEGGLQSRAEGAAGGALFGGALGVAAPVVIGGVQAALRPVTNAVNAAARPVFEAGRRIRQAMEGDQAAHVAGDAVMGAANPQRAALAQQMIDQGVLGQELRNVDRGGESVRALARSAANNSPEAREILGRMTNERFEGQSGRAVDFLRGLAITPGNAAATREQLLQAAAQANRPAYHAAYRAGDKPIWSATLEQLSGSPMVLNAMKNAAVRGKDRAIADGYGAFKPGVTVTESGIVNFAKGPQGVPTYPNLQYWDYVKRELDDAARSLLEKGERDAGGVATRLARSLRDELDAIVPAYSSARGTAARFFQAENALEAGEKFATQRFNVNEAASAIQRMTQPEREAFREGFMSRFLQHIDESGDRRNIVARIASSPADRQRIEMALGPNRAREMEAFLYVEQLMDLPRTAMSNSTTARQLVELGLAGGAGMLASGGNLSDPTTWIVGALTKYGAARGQQVIDQRMARNIAEMLVSRDPAVLQQGMRRVSSGPALSALRQAMTAIRKAQPAAIGSVSGSTMAQQPQNKNPE